LPPAIQDRAGGTIDPPLDAKRRGGGEVRYLRFAVFELDSLRIFGSYNAGGTIAFPLHHHGYAVAVPLPIFDREERVGPGDKSCLNSRIGSASLRIARFAPGGPPG